MGYPGNCSNHGETLEHRGGIKTELKHWNSLGLSKDYLLKMKNFLNSTVEVFEISGSSNLTNEGLRKAGEIIKERRGEIIKERRGRLSKKGGGDYQRKAGEIIKIKLIILVYNYVGKNLLKVIKKNTTINFSVTTTFI